MKNETNEPSSREKKRFKKSIKINTEVENVYKINHHQLSVYEWERRVMPQQGEERFTRGQ